MRSGVVSVVAGGWSFIKIPHEALPGHVIAVNDSAFHLTRRPDEIVSMDRLWTEHRWSWLCEKQIMTHLRRAAIKNVDIQHPAPSWLNIFDCDHETAQFYELSYPGGNVFQVYPNKLNGTNSGWCALNRAWQRRPRMLYLFGFDMQNGPGGEQHWHPPYPWKDEWKTPPSKFKSWAREADEIAKQFRDVETAVINVSDRSQIGVFPIMTPEEFLAKESAA